MTANDPIFEVAEQMGKLVELAAGHRQKAVDAGFTPEAAEQMAVALHAALMTKVSGG